MATRHSAKPIEQDMKVIVDVDLAILGTEPVRFAEYESQIRKEYDWVPETIFRLKRGAMLREFLARPHIYRTDPFVQTFDRQARENLLPSLAHG